MLEVKDFLTKRRRLTILFIFCKPLNCVTLTLFEIQVDHTIFVNFLHLYFTRYGKRRPRRFLSTNLPNIFSQNAYSRPEIYPIYLKVKLIFFSHLWTYFNEVVCLYCSGKPLRTDP